MAPCALRLIDRTPELFSIDGHAFRLDHQDENFNNANMGTYMDYTNDPNSNQHPNQYDYAHLESIYSHLHSTTTILSAAPKAMSEGAFEAQEEWGEVVGRDAKGRPNLSLETLEMGTR